MKIHLHRVDDAFHMQATDEQGHIVDIDSSPQQGGKGNGVRPMHLLIMGLGGCTAIDVIMILKKQRQDIHDFHITIEAEREKNKEPALWEKAHIQFTFTGQIDPGKAERAVELSMQKYCSVAETLRRGGTHISWEVQVKAPSSLSQSTTHP
ncbi:MAG: OsmC family protein [Thermoflavifilum sp.]|nr:OsmC family protein [Thermoflavifilum sp.]